ncbi:MAG: response regulator [Verrucomicrobiota bacterium JB023]|nr:response regulator [Verrucomicrobiota bacterium JB023]
MRIRSLILVLISLSFTALVTIGTWALLQANDLHDELVRENAKILRAESQARQAQALFKEQVQEWKNVLLRGHRTEDFERYWTSFEEKESRTRELISKLLGNLTEGSEAEELVEEFASQHLALGKSYREAVELFQSNGYDHRATDGLVRGQDRAPTELFDRIVQKLESDITNANVLAAVRERENQKRVFAAALAATALAFFILAYALHRWVSRPVSTATEQAKAIAGGEFRRFEISGGASDVRALQEALNVMSGRLEDSSREQEQLNRELRSARDEALEASVVKSQFLANISHEMRNPLNSIISMSSLISRTQLTSEQKSMAQIVRSAGETLRAVINDVLDFSKIEANKIEICEEPCVLEHLLEECIQIVAMRVDSSKVALGLLIDDEVPTGVMVDPLRLKQMIVNLLSNAAKFTEKGEIVLKAGRESTEGDRVVLNLEVQDTGIGIPKEKLGTVFEAFCQADGSTTKQFGGTGLGLTITRELAELMGGAVAVTSSEGVGTCFTIELPVTPCEVRIEQDSEVVAMLRGRSGLVIDRHHLNCEVVRRKLATYGAHIECCATLAEARQILAKEKDLDLLFIDDDYPELDGVAFAKSIKAERGSMSPAMIVLASYERALQIQDQKDSQFDAILTKPLTGQAIVSGLARIQFADHRLDDFIQVKKDEEAAQTEEEAGGGRRVLIVDDDPKNRKAMKMLLRFEGVASTAVNNGAEAVAEVEKGDYDFVLMDCSMPVMDGYEATRRIREKTLNRQPQIIGLTGHVSGEVQSACLKAGMNRYIAKPFEPEELLALLKEPAEATEPIF